MGRPEEGTGEGNLRLRINGEGAGFGKKGRGKERKLVVGAAELNGLERQMASETKSPEINQS